MKTTPSSIKPEKKNPQTPLFIVIISWILFVLLAALDVYEIVSGKGSFTIADIFADVGVLAVAIYFTVKFASEKKKAQ